jgi:uncharacterized repeat protein (TIGR01451 family)
MAWRFTNSLRLGSSALACGVLLLTSAATVSPSAPQPNPLAPIAPAGDTIFAAVTGVDILANGEAASLHGDPTRGRELFAHICIVCHGDRGTGGVLNPGSDDGTVPPLNPIDPGFLQVTSGDPAAFARAIDVFVQHGSRPAGPSPEVSMIPWGDKRLLSQEDISDVEAYVMELNGVTWPDRWAPPAEVRVEAASAADLITYTITLVNQGGSSLGNLSLQDTLPEGLTYVSSYFPSPGQNPAKVSGSTVEWTNLGGVAQGASLGPFVIIARTASTTPPNVAQLNFTWSARDGVTRWSSAVSNPTLPGPTPTPALFSLRAETPLPRPSPVATPIPTATSAPATVGVQMAQAGSSALSWRFVPSALVVRVGDTVNWTNAGTLQHTVTADDASFDSGLLNPGASFSFTFTSAGTYNFHCSPHPWMKGSIVVQGASG